MRSWPSPWRVAPAKIGIRLALGATPRHVLRSVFAGRVVSSRRHHRSNSIILLLAWRADSLTAHLLVSS